MLEQIAEAARRGKLVTVMCKEEVTGTQVEVLCIRISDKIIRPIARLYQNQAEAMTEVSPPESHRVYGTH